MGRLSSVRMRMIIFILFLSIVLTYSPLTVSMAQLTSISSMTQATTVLSTNTILTTMTMPAMVYTTSTEIVNKTVQETQTVGQTSVTSVTSSYTMTISGTVTQTITYSVTTVSTQTTSLLGNIWGVSLALVLLLGAVASFIVPRLFSVRPRGLVCSECGYRNPPFARSFCGKCGHSLRRE
jgi:ribosomal protein L40E